MASLPCQFHDEAGAVFTGTFLETGMSITVCQECLRDFMSHTLEEMSGIPVVAILEMDPATFAAEETGEETGEVVEIDGLVSDDYPEIDDPESIDDASDDDDQ